MREALAVATVSALEVPAWSVYEGDGLIPGLLGGVGVFGVLLAFGTLLSRIADKRNGGDRPL